MEHPDPDQQSPQDQTRAGQFRTTHWTMVVTAADPSAAGSAEALATLCQDYWYSVCTCMSVVWDTARPMLRT